MLKASPQGIHGCELVHFVSPASPCEALSLPYPLSLPSSSAQSPLILQTTSFLGTDIWDYHSALRLI